MKKILSAVFLVSFLSCAFPLAIGATETKFEFYFQRVEKVVQVNNPKPQGWWEKTKAFGKGILNTISSTLEKGVGRNFFPGEGRKLWYSGEDKNIAYQVNRVKVRSEAHLLELMGAKNGDLSTLSDGQKALLATYQHSKSQAIKDRMKYAHKSKMKIFLSDLTGFEDESKYPHVTRDFWPYAGPGLISMNSKRYEYPNSSEDAKSTFVHEFSHTLDKTMQEFFHAYGKDGSHFVNEKTHRRAAFCEGFAEFNQMLDFKKDVDYIKSAIKTIRFESTSEAGKYTDVSAADPKVTGRDLTEVEGVNALILYRLATELPGGKEKVFKAFTDTNYPWRSLRHLLRRFVKNNPGDAAAAAKILDEATLKKLSNSEMQEFLGKGEAVASYLASRNKTEKTSDSTAKAKSGTSAVKPVSVKTSNGSPFESEKESGK